MYLRAFKLAEQLRTALTTRAVIDQAKGVLMAVHSITADRAFRLLVEQSQHENVKLHALAERFIAGRASWPEAPSRRRCVITPQQGLAGVVALQAMARGLFPRALNGPIRVSGRNVEQPAIRHRCVRTPRTGADPTPRTSPCH